MGDPPGALHQAAVAARRQGRYEEARSHFEAALQAAPRDPDLLNGYANLLLDLGDAEGARLRYRQALEARPDHADTLANLAAACKRLGARAEARRALERALDVAPGHPRALHSLGLLLAEAGALAEAAAALDRALAARPDNRPALWARARVERDAGGDAAPYYARARALAPQDLALALDEATGLQQAGRTSEATARLEALVAAEPRFADAHAALSRLRWQAGDKARFTEAYEAALAAHPENGALWLGLMGALMRSGQPQAVLARLDAARPALGPLADGLEAAAATEAGDGARADAAFARLDPMADPALRIAWLRRLLRRGDARAAAGFALAAAQAGDAAAWPYLATAWRLLDDPRWTWLEGDPAFVRALDLPLGGSELAALAEVLRGLHRAREAPFDQTLKGGTQTEGPLLFRREPEIVRLRSALSEAIAEYIAGLPPPDPRHPLLSRPRGGFRFAGSWSVRLSGAGFHVNHVHTTGWLSSAFYVAVPEEIAAGSEAGWLTFGEPPAELGLALPPFRTIQPRPGRLALFPSTMWHGTRPFQAGERLTVAFDVVPAE